MYCSRCGNQVGAGSQFCSNCGNPVAQTGPTGQPGYDVTQQQPTAGGYPPPPGAAVPPPPVGPPLTPGPQGPPPPEPSGGRGNGRLIVEIVLVVIVIGVLLGVAAALIVGSGSDDESSKTKTEAASSDSGTSTDTEGFDDSGDTSDSGGRRSTTTTTTTTAPLSPVDAARRDDAAGYAFMQKLEGLMNRANMGRSEIGPLIAAVQNNCSRDPNDAVAAVNVVVNNRQALLDEIASAGLTPNSFQIDLATKFQTAMSTSIEADRAYARWLNYVRDYYYRPPQGCLGNPPTDANWDDAQRAEGAVTPAKADFIAAYNAQATRFGMKTWTVDQI